MWRWWLLAGLLVVTVLIVEYFSLRNSGATISRHFWRYAKTHKHAVLVMGVIVFGVAFALFAHLAWQWP